MTLNTHHDGPQPAQAAPFIGERSPDDLLTNDDFSSAVHSSPRTTEKWRMTGEGPPFIRTGRRVLYRWGDVLDWLEQRKVHSTSEEQAA